MREWCGWRVGLWLRRNKEGEEGNHEGLLLRGYELRWRVGFCLWWKKRGVVVDGGWGR